MRGWLLGAVVTGLVWLGYGLAGLSQLTPLVAGILVLAATALSALVLSTPSDRSVTIDSRALSSTLFSGLVAAAVVVVLCNLLHKPNVWIPLIGMVLGLHLIPLARAVSLSELRLAGVLLAGLNLATLLWPAAPRQVICGLGGCAVFWGLTLWVARHGSRITSSS